ncbi:MAG: hypothetical protein GY834_05030 [Bacteroidetes bacterium]|nr:hypothetical protein [Bacteroidota bacterium]
MKRSIAMIILLILPLFCISSNKNRPEEKSSLLTVSKTETIDNFFQSDRFYLAGQPNYETFVWLKSEGVGLVINLRSEGENATFAESAFDEENLLESLDLAYVSIPMSGMDAYCPETVEKLANAINRHEGKILIHCTSCGRATSLWMAYLIKYKSFSVDEAIVVGKQLKFKFYLENLLDSKISMSIVE